MSADELVQQVYAWLDEANEKFDIEVLLDLPELDWVELVQMTDRGDLINLVYKPRGLSGILSKSGNDMVCPRSAVKAVRRTERHDFGDLLGGPK